MKKTTITLIATVTILISFTGCDKYHRDRYTGNWEFVTERYKYVSDDHGNLSQKEYDTTFYFLGIIALGNYENHIIIKYMETDEVTAGVDMDGLIYVDCSLSYSGKFSTGEFVDKNKMNLRFDRKEYTQLDDGGYYVTGEYYEMQGTKKSKKREK